MTTTLSDVDREILQCMVDAWAEEKMLPGDISMNQAWELINRLGLSNREPILSHNALMRAGGDLDQVLPVPTE